MDNVKLPKMVLSWSIWIDDVLEGHVSIVIIYTHLNKHNYSKGFNIVLSFFDGKYFTRNINIVFCSIWAGLNDYNIAS